MPYYGWPEDASDLPHTEIRELTTWRWYLQPICWLFGHKPAWIRSLQPNPRAIGGGHMGGCARCSCVLRKKPQ